LIGSRLRRPTTGRPRYRSPLVMHPRFGISAPTRRRAGLRHRQRRCTRLTLPRRRQPALYPSRPCPGSRRSTRHPHCHPRTKIRSQRHWPRRNRPRSAICAPAPPPMFPSVPAIAPISPSRARAGYARRVIRPRPRLRSRARRRRRLHVATSRRAGRPISPSTPPIAPISPCTVRAGCARSSGDDLAQATPSRGRRTAGVA